MIHLRQGSGGQVYTADKRAELARAFRHLHVLNISLATAGKGGLAVACDAAEKEVSALLLRAQADALEAAAQIAFAKAHSFKPTNSDAVILAEVAFQIGSSIRALIPVTP